MSRNLFPADGEQLVLNIPRSGPVTSAAGSVLLLFNDADATSSADILDENQNPVFPAGTLVLDEFSMVPRFYGPNDDSETIYARVAQGPVVVLHMRQDARIRDVQAVVADVQDVAKRWKGTLDQIQAAQDDLDTSTKSVRGQAQQALQQARQAVNDAQSQIGSVRTVLDNLASQVSALQDSMSDMTTRVVALEGPAQPVPPAAGGA
jgi:flagellin-like hook-associated protein FlgL